MVTYLSWKGEGEEVDEHVGQVGEKEQNNDAKGSQDVVGEDDFAIILTELSKV